MPFPFALRPALRAGALAILTLTALLPAVPASALSRIKDLVSVEGVRENQLVGYGLVVGLNGTGDTLNNTPFTPPVTSGDAGAARREYPRRESADGQCRSRDGHRQSSTFRNAGHAG